MIVWCHCTTVHHGTDRRYYGTTDRYLPVGDSYQALKHSFVMVKPPRHPQLRDNVESHRGCRAGRPGGVPREGQVGTPSPVPAPAMTIILEMTCAGTANPVKRLSHGGWRNEKLFAAFCVRLTIRFMHQVLARSRANPGHNNIKPCVTQNRHSEERTLVQ